MAKRAFDIVVAALAGLVAAPVLLAAAIGIKLSDRGPVFYRARRAGRRGEPFELIKLRTMRVSQDEESQITAHGDNRVFRFGALLRLTKVDELPQLWNILTGDMSIVGPRPESVDIVDGYYRPEHRETLDVPPGLASPGSIYNYTHGEALIGPDAPERDYLEKVLPTKLGLELVYVTERSLRYDLSVIRRTIKTIVLTALGRKEFPDPPELDYAEHRFLYPVAPGSDDRAA